MHAMLEIFQTERKWDLSNHKSDVELAYSAIDVVRFETHHQTTILPLSVPKHLFSLGHWTNSLQACARVMIVNEPVKTSKDQAKQFVNWWFSQNVEITLNHNTAGMSRDLLCVVGVRSGVFHCQLLPCLITNHFWFMIFETITRLSTKTEVILTKDGWDWMI